MALVEILRWHPVGLGAPGSDQWPLFILSKLALVLAPMAIVLAYRKIASPLFAGSESDERGRMAHLLGKASLVGEKLLAHAAFYVGMGFPIIGLSSLLDFPRLVGFTVTNFFFHEITPHLFQERWLKRLFPEWIPTLGVNLLMGEELLEISAYIGERGQLKVIESPYSQCKGFLRSVSVEKRGGECHAIVELKSFYVPEHVRPILRIRSPVRMRQLTRDQIGKLIRVDLGELEPFAMPVYVNEFGQRSILWREQYWTKFFNEVGGRSYVTYPFGVLRKAVTVLVGTPMAFATGNLLVHLSQGGALGWDVYRFFSYGIIFAFTLGGMYGASLGSTFVEVGTWFYSRWLRKLKIIVEPASARAMQKKSRFRSLKWGPNKFGVLLEERSFFYRAMRFGLGGIVAGGLGAWFLTAKVGGTWQQRVSAWQDDYFLQASSADKGRAVPENLPNFVFPSAEKQDFAHRIFEAEVCPRETRL